MAQGERISPRERWWTDARDQEWWVCDGCDAPARYEDTFWASPLRETNQDAVVYCQSCARQVAIGWATRWAAGEVDPEMLGVADWAEQA